MGAIAHELHAYKLHTDKRGQVIVLSEWWRKWDGYLIIAGLPVIFALASITIYSAKQPLDTAQASSTGLVNGQVKQIEDCIRAEMRAALEKPKDASSQRPVAGKAHADPVWLDDCNSPEWRVQELGVRLYPAEKCWTVALQIFLFADLSSGGNYLEVERRVKQATDAEISAQLTPWAAAVLTALAHGDLPKPPAGVNLWVQGSFRLCDKTDSVPTRPIETWIGVLGPNEWPEFLRGSIDQKLLWSQLQCERFEHSMP